MKKLLRDTLLFCALVLALQIVVVFDYSIERDLETGRGQALRIGIARPYVPEPEILAIQEHQQTHPRLGFLWTPDIGTTHEVIVGWGDIPAGPIFTDSIGFANSPPAIHQLRRGDQIDIIGVGASYMGGAQSVFHEYLGFWGLFYYSLAHGRYTLPQYTIALRDYGLPANPSWVIYGVNEVSFTLIPDFEGWEASGLDWFTYHSGTWCGPPLKTGFPHDWLREYPRIYDQYQAVSRSLVRPSAAGSTPRNVLIDKTLEYIREARDLATAGGSNFVVLLIPAKVRMVQGAHPSLYLFEELLPRLEDAALPFIDLRESFSQVDDPGSLYFTLDAHWNRLGVTRAAREVLAHIERHNRDQEQLQ